MRTVVFVLFSFCGWFLCTSQLGLGGDTLNAGQNISDSATLVSAQGYFSLGFFSSGRYLGIWYNRIEPQTVVWVANRDNPVVNSKGVFQIAEDGNIVVVDTYGKIYWSSKRLSSSRNLTVKLMDSGNLMLRDGQLGINLWQSFEHPTDTFLPGMKMNKFIELTCWRSSVDPGSGNFTFKLAPTGDNSYIISKNQGRIHWESGGLNSKAMPPTIADYLTGFTLKSSKRSIPTALHFQNTRLVMNSTGEIQYLTYGDDINSGWSKGWWEPADECKIYNACGSFSSCNTKNSPHCKCLPGFKPDSRKNQSSGELFEGCARKTTSCSREDITFLNLTMIKVEKPDKQVIAPTEAECQSQCLNMCPRCQAYSYNARREDRSTACLIWTKDLLTLQEDYPDDDSHLSVRVQISDIAPTGRSCEPCGTNIIPYPLSTGRNCGDPIYLKLSCDNVTGLVSFRMPRENRVTRIDPDSRKLVIQIEHSYFCDAKDQRERFDLPFNVTNWCFGQDQIEVTWLPPQEPPCSNAVDCKVWPHSTCNATRQGQGRCLCDANYHWDGSTLNCTQANVVPGSIEGPKPKGNNSLSLILGITISSLIFLACIIAFAYVWRRKIAHKQERGSIQRIRGRLYDSERHVKDLIDLRGLDEKDNEGIEVPYVELESILEATDNFSDANKLGRGGYGPVYKGKLPGGQDIAVKRLSSVSSQGLQEFKNEVVLIAKLQHRNLVRLRGYCIKGEEKILLYEYMPNKSLDLFIFDPTQSIHLDWHMRVDIILGVARGMLYLHQDSRLRVIHRDLKTSNILLDEEMQPKISDFGLAKIFGGKETEANTERVVGTYGYMSPEYALDGLFSTKSDVFSFGVVLFEIISGKKNTGFYQSKQALSLLGYAWKLWIENKLLDLMDSCLVQTCNASQFIKYATVGLLCVQDEPVDRPTMSNVVTMLDSETVTLPTPKQPTFFVSRGLSSSGSSSKPLQFPSSSQEGR